MTTLEPAAAADGAADPKTAGAAKPAAGTTELHPADTADLQAAGGPADPADAGANFFARAMKTFTLFRRTRPFWGAIWLAAGGWIIMSLTFAPIQVTLAAGVGGISGYLLGGGMVVFAVFAMFVPSQRQLAGLLGVAFAIAALVLSNLGGFLVGMLLGVLGGGMVFAWGPKPEHPLLRRVMRRVRSAPVAADGPEARSRAEETE